jgi:xanthine dehydrogenase accessory factor
MVTGLSAIDSLVVTMHDDEDAGPVLFTALRSPVGYIGSLGGRARQEARRDWLVGRGINDISRIHGPAGLDIGGTSPAHSAVAILAEAISAHSGRNDT